MSNLFDYNPGEKKRPFFQPKNWHIVPLTFIVVFLYFFLERNYHQKQQDLAYQLTTNAVKFTKNRINELGELQVINKKLYAGDSLMSKTYEIVDEVQRSTGFGCTVFLNDVRIANTDYTRDSISRVIGTKAESSIANRVLQGGTPFLGIVKHLGAKRVIVYEPLRDSDGHIIGMISCFKEHKDIIKDLNNFRLFLGSSLTVLYLVILVLILLAARWSKFIENQNFVMQEKNKQLHNLTKELTSTYESLQGSEEKFKDFFENSYDLIQSVDLEGNFLFVNTSWLKTLGYDYHEILNLTTNDVVHPDYQKQFAHMVERARKGDDVLGEDMVFLTKERDAILLNGNIHCEYYEEKAVAMRGVFRNDTTRKLAQKKMEESERQYRFLVESADDLIFRTDYKGNFVYANEIVREVTGYNMDEFLTKNYIELIKEDHRNAVMEFYANQFNHRLEVSYFEFQIQRKNGEYIWVGQNVKTLFKGDDKSWIEGYLVVSRDITDRKRKEEQINLQNKQLEDQNRSIKESIRYAKRIQDSILPNEKQLSEIFPESFVVYQPKDIVSGDFYWVAKQDHLQFIAVADCTGHGVPAAFMSIIGSNQLNRAINRKKLTKPVDILKEISEGFRKVLKRPMDDTEIQDGMDIALCCINTKTKEVQFCGAFNDLYLIRDKELEKLKGARISVGADEKTYRQIKFEQRSFKLKKKDMIYLFSDGYADQFGGAEGRKMGYERFRQVLLKIHNEDMIDQKHLLEETMREWRGAEEQIDDICVLGVRF